MGKDFVRGVDNVFTPRSVLQKLRQVSDEFAMEQDARSRLDKNSESFISDARRTADKEEIVCQSASMAMTPDRMGRKRDNLYELPTLLVLPKIPETTSTVKNFRLTVSSCEQVHKLLERSDASNTPGSSVVGAEPGLCSGETMLVKSLAMTEA